MFEIKKRPLLIISHSGFGNNTINNGGNTIVGIAVHYDIPLSFGREVYGEVWVLFRVDGINCTSCDVDGAPDIGHPAPMLITVVILLEGH